MNDSYVKYHRHLKKITDLKGISALMLWDQETYMPPKGASFRARQLASLTGIMHELAIDEDFGKLLLQLSSNNSLTEKERRNVTVSLEEYEKQKKYPTEFVQTLSRTISECFEAWHKAKTENDFSIFAPLLSKLIDLKRQECDILTYKDHPYDALLNEYEPGAKTKDLEVLFNDVRIQLVEFVEKLSMCDQVNDDFMYHHYDKDKQWEFGISLLKQMGYDFKAGRQDISTHPFTTNFGSTDVRITTRINENDLNEMIWCCIHEGGHALYEQGFSVENYGLPTGEYLSLGMHESQSRLWENNIGRALPFWKANFPALQKIFPGNLGNVTVEDFYKAMNRVNPSLIRVSSDELTYHFHIMVRFEIEKALIEGSLDVNDLPDCWNAKYKEYLNIDVPSDQKGVLQDIHWSHGSLGYFPTYSLGSFYAAQFFAQARKDVPDLEKEIENGNMKPMLEWLRENIHRHGKMYPAEDLCIQVTGEKLNFENFMNYAREKYGKIYNLAALAE